eukprot:CAMPEP_0196139174 /NCGR_PEP_ID=MMETSP0910-20130528/6549_1 /TAXON_ID=49265 /ORGANISM="Thalassiosira rotula, Strain GSO102" /LENGTH=331 /DNA_ID=CAMNT_0041399871 /DNA_START=145 /DNA_END=1137 /DNA_ORIENTATION=-
MYDTEAQPPSSSNHLLSPQIISKRSMSSTSSCATKVTDSSPPSSAPPTPAEVGPSSSSSADDKVEGTTSTAAALTTTALVGGNKIGEEDYHFIGDLTEVRDDATEEAMVTSEVPDSHLPTTTAPVTIAQDQDDDEQQEDDAKTNDLQNDDPEATQVATVPAPTSDADGIAGEDARVEGNASAGENETAGGKSAECLKSPPLIVRDSDTRVDVGIPTPSDVVGDPAANDVETVAEPIAAPRTLRPPPQATRPPRDPRYAYLKRYSPELADFTTALDTKTRVGRRCYRLNLERPFDIHCEQSPLEYGDYMAPWTKEVYPDTVGPTEYCPPRHL